MKKVKIYLSSSAELKEERHEIEMLFARMNQHSQSNEVFYELLMWETLPAAVSNMRMQDEYNKVILECDVFILLVHSKIGKYTLEEFETAYHRFLENRKPLIFTYFKDTSIRASEVTESNILSLLDFKRRLSEIGHFYLQYQTTESLKLSLATQMQRYFGDKLVGDFSKKSSTNNINVFVSYNHNDKETAIKVVEKLKENGFSTILDIESMLPGSDIQSFIEDSILNSHFTISIVSRNSLLSTWVAMETIGTFNSESKVTRKFLAAVIDDSFFKRKFTDEAIDSIDAEINEIVDMLKGRIEKKTGFADLYGEFTRYLRLRNGIDEIIRRLKESLSIDITSDKFDQGLEKLIKFMSKPIN